MGSRRLLHLFVALGLLVGLSAGAPAIVSATGTTISNETDADDFWPHVTEAPNGTTLAAAWNAGTSVRVAISTNSGASWSNEIELTRGSGYTDVEGEQIAYDSNGNLHLIWFQQPDASSSRSVQYRYVPAGQDASQAANWSTGGNLCSGGCLRPDLNVDRNGNVYATYELSGDTKIRKLSSLGQWEGTVHTLSDCGQARIAATPDGKLHIACLNDGQGITYARYTSFANFTQEFEDEVSTARSNIRPDIAADGQNHAHIVWSQFSGDSRPVHYSEYRADGGNPTSPLRIAASAVSGGDTHFSPTVAAKLTGDVYAAWQGGSNAGGDVIYRNQRIGGTWGDANDHNARRVTPSGGKAEMPQLGTSINGGINLVFIETEGGKRIAKFLGISPGIVDTVAPTVSGLTITPTSGSQRAGATVSGTDTAPTGATPTGIASIQYSFNGSSFATASPAPSGNPTSLTDFAFNVDLANPVAGGSWTSGSRTFYVRLVDAAGNVGPAVSTGTTVSGLAASTTRYLAEGYTGGTFDEYVTLTNPSGSETIYVSLLFQYAGSSSGTPGTLVTIAPNKRETVKIDDVAGEGKELSIRLDSNRAFFAERPMYFQNYSTAGVAYNKPRASALSGINGGHLGVAADNPAPDWYFAEGYTGAGFEGYFTIQNPQGGTSNVQITYYLAGGGTSVKNITVDAGSRKTVVIHSTSDPGGIGPNQTFSARVSTTNSVNIIVERVQYFRYSGSMGAVTGGTATLGTTAPATTWYFAEGFTGSGFDQYLTIQNPNGSAGTATITYYITGQATPTTKTVNLLPNSRTTVSVHDANDPGGIGRGFANSVKVETGPLQTVVERPIYHLYNGTPGVTGIDGGHNVMGAKSLIAPGTSVVLAEGYTGSGFNQYLTFQNPNPGDVGVSITYLLSDASTVTRSLNLPANQRTTVAVHNASDPTGAGLGPDRAFSTRVTVTGGASILVERVMYFNYNNGATGGSSAFGIAS